MTSNHGENVTQLVTFVIKSLLNIINACGAPIISAFVTDSKTRNPEIHPFHPPRDCEMGDGSSEQDARSLRCEEMRREKSARERTDERNRLLACLLIFLILRKAQRFCII